MNPGLGFESGYPTMESQTTGTQTNNQPLVEQSLTKIKQEKKGRQSKYIEILVKLSKIWGPDLGSRLGIYAQTLNVWSIYIPTFTVKSTKSR